MGRAGGVKVGGGVAVAGSVGPAVGVAVGTGVKVGSASWMVWVAVAARSVSFNKLNEGRLPGAAIPVATAVTTMGDGKVAVVDGWVGGKVAAASFKADTEVTAVVTGVVSGRQAARRSKQKIVEQTLV